MSKKLSRAKILAIAEQEANFYGNPSEATSTTSTTTNNDDTFDGEAEYRAAILRRQRRIAIRARFLLDDAEEDEEESVPAAEEIAAEPVTEPVVEPVAKPVAEPVAGSPPPPPSPPMTAPVVACSPGVNLTPVADAQPELTCDDPPVSGNAGCPPPPPPPIIVPVAEEDVVMASPHAVIAHSEPTFSSGSSCFSFLPFLATACSVVSASEPVNDIPDDPMEVDGPEFYMDIDSLGDQMDVDFFCPALGRELGHLLGFTACRASGWSVGFKKPTRLSCRLGVRSEKSGALVGGSPTISKMAIRRRSRMASRRKVGSGSRRVSFAGVGRKTNISCK